MSDMLERISRVLEDLRAIEAELSSMTAKDFDEFDRLAQFDLVLQNGVIQQFKETVDSLRHLLWAYIEKISEAHHISPEEALQNYRIQRVTAMLNAIKQSKKSLNELPASGTESFLSEILNFACYVTDTRRAEDVLDKLGKESEAAKDEEPKKLS